MATAQHLVAGRAMPAPAADELRRDLRLIADMIEPGARVLDIGCGDGALLAYLMRHKRVDGRGMELSQSGVNACVGHGLSVIQGDADRDLEAYPSGAFDIVVLSQTLQATRNPRRVVQSLVRIGRRAIVSFPNFGFWRIRLKLLITGRMPVSPLLSFAWYETPNIHLCTISDFVALCDELGIRIERGVTLDRLGRPYSLGAHGKLANLLAEQSVFVLSGGAPADPRPPALGRRPGASAPTGLAREAVRRRGIDEVPPRLTGRPGLGINLLCRLDQDDAGDGREEARPDPLPGRRRAQDDAFARRRDEQRGGRPGRREQLVAQELGELRDRVRPAGTKRRPVESRPDAAPVRRHDQEAAAAGQHAPYLLQHQADLA
jgi:methionine biosynthesis protein MetW